ncbi:MAG: HTH-type transcriptional repressor CarH [Fimbriimonadales bacterium]|nr:MAG: HTH-type transcriptional repressor CarH [Fimbriimonadales bacterium]
MPSFHPIGAVAKATHLSVHTIRMWERRYQAIRPERSSSGRRLYSDEDIQKLKLLKRAVEQGQSIQLIANLSIEELRALLSDASMPPPLGSEDATEAIEQCMAAIRAMKRERLSALLERAATVMGIQTFVEGLAAPLIRWVGEEWHKGKLSVAQEHLASSEIRHRLFTLGNAVASRNGARRLLITTPAGHVHELGAAMMMVIAARRGWAVTYLGPDLPAHEIAEACLIGHADAIALSLVFPADDEKTRQELRRLRSLVGDVVPILVGGQAAPSYQDVLREINAISVEALAQGDAALADLERRGRLRS